MAGTCIERTCTKSAAPGRARCAHHMELARNYKRAATARARADGLCRTCRGKVIPGRRECQACFADRTAPIAAADAAGLCVYPGCKTARGTGRRYCPRHATIRNIAHKSHDSNARPAYEVVCSRCRQRGHNARRCTGRMLDEQAGRGKILRDGIRVLIALCSESWRLSELSAEVGIKWRTLYRIVDELRSAGIPISVSSRRDGKTGPAGSYYTIYSDELAHLLHAEGRNAPAADAYACRKCGQIGHNSRTCPQSNATEASS